MEYGNWEGKGEAEGDLNPNIERRKKKKKDLRSKSSAYTFRNKKREQSDQKREIIKVRAEINRNQENNKEKINQKWVLWD